MITLKRDCGRFDLDEIIFNFGGSECGDWNVGLGNIFLKLDLEE